MSRPASATMSRSTIERSAEIFWISFLTRLRGDAAGVEHQRVALDHPEPLAPPLVDDGVDGADLRRRVGPDVDRVGDVAGADVEVVVGVERQPVLERLQDGDLAVGDPVPLHLEGGALRPGEAAVRRGIDRREVEHLALDRDLTDRELLARGDTRLALDLDRLDPVDQVLRDRLLADDQQVVSGLGVLQRTRRLGGRPGVRRTPTGGGGLLDGIARVLAGRLVRRTGAGSAQQRDCDHRRQPRATLRNPHVPSLPVRG